MQQRTSFLYATSASAWIASIKDAMMNDSQRKRMIEAELFQTWRTSERQRLLKELWRLADLEILRQQQNQNGNRQ